MALWNGPTDAQAGRMTNEDVPRGPSWRGVLPGLGGMVLLGSTVAVIGATHHLPSFAVQSARYAVAALGIVAVARCLRVRLVPPRGRELVWVVAGALSGLVLFNLAVVLGTRHTEPGVFGAAVACVPIVLAVAGPMARGGRPPARLVAGAVVVSVGAVAVAGWSRADIPGVLLAASLPVCEAAFTLFGARVVGRLGAWSYSAATCGVAAASFLVLSVVVERPDPAGFADPAVLLAVGYLGLLGTAVAFVLWFTCVRRVGAGVAGLTAGIAAPSTALCGFAFGAPLPSAGAWLGMGLIAAGLAVGLAPARRAAARHPVDAP